MTMWLNSTTRMPCKGKEAWLGLEEEAVGLAGGEVGDVELGDDVDTVDLVAGEDRGGLGGTGGQDQAGDEGQHAHGKGSESGWKVRVLRDGDVPGYDSCES